MKKMFSIILVALVVLVAGVCVVYYNTGSLIYEEVYLLSYNNESVTFLDYTLYYSDVIEVFEKVRSIFPVKPIHCAKHI